MVTLFVYTLVPQLGKTMTMTCIFKNDSWGEQKLEEKFGREGETNFGSPDFEKGRETTEERTGRGTGVVNLILSSIIWS